MFMVHRQLLRSGVAVRLDFLICKLDDLLDMLLLLVMWLLDMLGEPDWLLHFFKDAMLRLFRDYLDPMLRDKGRLRHLHLGR